MCYRHVYEYMVYGMIWCIYVMDICVYFKYIYYIRLFGSRPITPNIMGNVESASDMDGYFVLWTLEPESNNNPGESDPPTKSLPVRYNEALNFFHVLLMLQIAGWYR